MSRGDDVGVELRRADGGVIAVEVVGEPDASPVLFCHGLADSRLSARSFAGAAREVGLRLVAPDRPGIGGTNARRLNRVVDWVPEATLVLDALDGRPGGAARCLGRRSVRGGLRGRDGPPSPKPAADLAARPGYLAHPRDGGRAASVLAGGQTRSGLRRLVSGPPGQLARRAPRLFLRLATSEMPDIDRRALAQPDLREAFLTNYLQAFQAGSWGVGQDLRLLTRPWGFHLEAITVPTSIHHGDADTTVPLQHARRFAEAIPGAQLRIHPGHGHFSILDAPDRTLATLAE